MKDGLRAGLLALLAVPFCYAAAQDFPPLRVQVRLVNVFVNVTNPAGAPVPGLTRDDFAISEDGHPQKLAIFERQSELPLSIALAIDTSGSVQKDLGIEKAAAHEFVHTLLRPIDQLAVFDFNTTVREVTGYSNNLHRIDNGIDDLSKGPATALYSAVQTASQSLAAFHGRKVLLLISDGGNTVPGVSYEQALEQALRGEVMVYSIIDLPVLNDAGRDVGGEHALITLSQETGGNYYYVEHGDLTAVFRQVSDDLRTEYLLGYYPAKLPLSHSDYHAIAVKLTPAADSAYTLRYRAGYYSNLPPADQDSDQDQ